MYNTISDAQAFFSKIFCREKFILRLQRAAKTEVTAALPLPSGRAAAEVFQLPA
jgi:hypothetical protein